VVVLLPLMLLPLVFSWQHYVPSVCCLKTMTLGSLVLLVD
tara:strand:- start:269 stop:388 length:120 start_codon:yes stop_codon:yes gene_type:complete